MPSRKLLARLSKCADLSCQVLNKLKRVPWRPRSYQRSERRLYRARRAVGKADKNENDDDHHDDDDDYGDAERRYDGILDETRRALLQVLGGLCKTS